LEHEHFYLNREFRHFADNVVTIVVVTIFITIVISLRSDRRRRPKLRYLLHLVTVRHLNTSYMCTSYQQLVFDSILCTSGTWYDIPAGTILLVLILQPGIYSWIPDSSYGLVPEKALLYSLYMHDA